MIRLPILLAVAAAVASPQPKMLEPGVISTNANEFGGSKWLNTMAHLKKLLEG